MTINSVATLVAALRKSRLLTPEQLKQVTGDFQARFSEPRALARHIMRLDWLTPYQINQLFQGQAKHLILGPYRLLERLGEGGMGQVFKARHEGLHRVVALKVMRKERMANPDSIRRFHREIRAAAQLSHPNIVMAYDADEVDGTHFFAMEYVDGIDLDQLVRKAGPLPVEQACDYIRQAALGLQHALECGLVHRDIKPANLLLAYPPGRGGTIPPESSGSSSYQTPVVKILDMGLARLHHSEGTLESATSLTQEGKVVGTPDFMAPEQATNSHTADIRADLYSLGCTLYYLLTGHVLYGGGTPMEKLLRHRLEPPPPIERVRPGLPAAVRAIIYKLLAKRPEDRYLTPAELAAVLAALNTPVQAPPQVRAGVSEPAPVDVFDFFSTPGSAGAAPPSSADLITPTDLTEARSAPVVSIATREAGPTRHKRESAHRTVYRVAVGIFGLLMVATVGLLAGWLFNKLLADRRAAQGGPQPQAEDPLTAELEGLRETTANPEEYRRRLLDFRWRHAGTAQAQRVAAMLLGLRSPLDRLDARLIPAEERAIWSAPELVAVAGESRQRHWGPVLCVAYSPAGQLVASGGADHVVRLWVPPAMRPRAVLSGHTGPVQALAFAPNRSVLASGSADQTILLWDLSGQEPRKWAVLKDHTGPVRALAFAPDGKTLASAGLDGTVRLWDLERSAATGRIVRKGIGAVYALAFGSRTKVLAAGGEDGKVHLWSWDQDATQKLATLEGHKEAVQALAFTPDGKLLASGGADRTVRLWDLTGDQPRKGSVLGDHTGPVNSVAFAPTGRLLASGGRDETVRLWALDGATPWPEAVIQGAAHSANGLAFAPDGMMLVSGGQDTTVRLWALAGANPQELMPLHPPAGGRTCVAFTPDAHVLASVGGEDGCAYLLDLTAARPRERRAETDHGAQCLALAHDGKTLASAGWDKVVRVWDGAALSKEPVLLAGHSGPITALAFSPDGKTLASGSRDKTVRLWTVTQGKPQLLSQLGGHAAEVAAMAFTPDGKTLAVGCADGTVRLWDVAGPEPRPRRVLEAHAGGLRTLAFAPDGDLLATGGADAVVRLWECASGEFKEDKILATHGKKVSAVVFSIDGKTLASAGEEGEVIVWSVASGEQRRHWTLPGPIHGLAFATDGRHLATANANGTAYILRIATPPPG
jgi:WD40 repeat protein/serine/threonine protein kinase